MPFDNTNIETFDDFEPKPDTLTAILEAGNNDPATDAIAALENLSVLMNGLLKTKPSELSKDRYQLAIETISINLCENSAVDNSLTARDLVNGVNQVGLNHSFEANAFIQTIKDIVAKVIAALAKIRDWFIKVLREWGPIKRSRERYWAEVDRAAKEAQKKAKEKEMRDKVKVPKVVVELPPVVYRFFDYYKHTPKVGYVYSTESATRAIAGVKQDLIKVIDSLLQEQTIIDTAIAAISRDDGGVGAHKELAKLKALAQLQDSKFGTIGLRLEHEPLNYHTRYLTDKFKFKDIANEYGWVGNDGSSGNSFTLTLEVPTIHIALTIRAGQN